MTTTQAKEVRKSRQRNTAVSVSAKDVCIKRATDRAGFLPSRVYLDALDFAEFTGGLWPAEALALLRGELPESWRAEAHEQREHESQQDASNPVDSFCRARKSLLLQRTVALIATIANLQASSTGEPEQCPFHRGWIAFDASEFSNVSGGLTPDDVLGIFRGESSDLVRELFRPEGELDPRQDPRHFYEGLQDLANVVDCRRTALIFATLGALRRGALRRGAAIGRTDAVGATLQKAA